MQKFLITLLLMISLTSCTQDEVGAFRTFSRHFSDTASFALATVGGRQILLVSQETFGNDTDSSKEAIDASIFALDQKGKVVCLGSVRSQGTLYPVSILDDRIMVAGHHFMKIYGIRGDLPELFLDICADEDGPELDSLFEVFESGAPVLFKKNL